MSKPTKEGWLSKLGGIRRSWKLRYCRIIGSEFVYFKDAEADKPQGYIPLKNAVVSWLDDAKYRKTGVFGIKAQYGERVYELTDGTLEGRERWIEAIQAAIAGTVPAKPGKSKEGKRKSGLAPNDRPLTEEERKERDQRRALRAQQAAEKKQREWAKLQEKLRQAAEQSSGASSTTQPDNALSDSITRADPAPGTGTDTTSSVSQSNGDISPAPATQLVSADAPTDTDGSLSAAAPAPAAVSLEGLTPEEASRVMIEQEAARFMAEQERLQQQEALYRARQQRAELQARELREKEAHERKQAARRAAEARVTMVEPPSSMGTSLGLQRSASDLSSQTQPAQYSKQSKPRGTVSSSSSHKRSSRPVDEASAAGGVGTGSSASIAIPSNIEVRKVKMSRSFHARSLPASRASVLYEDDEEEHADHNHDAKDEDEDEDEDYEREERLRAQQEQQRRSKEAQRPVSRPAPSPAVRLGSSLPVASRDSLSERLLGEEEETRTLQEEDTVDAYLRSFSTTSKGNSSSGEWLRPEGADEERSTRRRKPETLSISMSHSEHDKGCCTNCLIL